MSHRLQIVEYASPARLGTSVSAALDSVKTLEGCAIEEHPELIILNLNSLDSKAVTNENVWKEWVDALRVRLAARPNESLGGVIHRKMHPMGREFLPQ